MKALLLIAFAVVASAQNVAPVVNAGPDQVIPASAQPRTVLLSWTHSVSPNVAGYHIYRSLTPGGQDTRVTATPIFAVSFLDSGLMSGLTYYYTATAVDGNGLESVRSNQVIAVIP